MKILFDLFPVILFFATFKVAEGRKEDTAQLLDSLFGALGLPAAFAPDQAPILLATVVVIVATFAQIAWVWFRHGKVDKMLWVSLGLIVVLGGLTLALRDDTFIKWKPTVLYWIFACVLVASATLFGKNLIRAMLEAQIEAPDHIWARLNLAWAGFFVVLGGANLFVAMSFPTDTWVNFKLFGTMGLMFAFVVGQGVWLNRKLDQVAAAGSKETDGQ
ncbi:MAG TPA: septation protein A [Rhodocyclaceae bacterium]|nr:septation protein A [Rhodocyclaceae bacterium]